MKYKMIGLLLGLKLISCQSFRRSDFSLNSNGIQNDTTNLNICVLREKDSMPIIALVSLIDGSKSISHFNNDSGFVKFKLIPAEWKYFEVYSDGYESIYKANPFVKARSGFIDTTIYLREYQVISDDFMKH